jgi:hypothetical protein
MTSQVHPTIQNAAERSFWKIRRFTAEKLDPIGLRSCFNHLNRMQAMSIRTKNLANLKVTDTSETFLKTSTKFLWTRHDPESFLDGQTWNTFNSHCTSTDYRREWSSSLNECRQSWMRPIPVGIWQVKRYGYICFSSLFNNFSHETKLKELLHVLERGCQLKNSAAENHLCMEVTCNVAE